LIRDRLGFGSEKRVLEKKVVKTLEQKSTKGNMGDIEWVEIWNGRKLRWLEEIPI